MDCLKTEQDPEKDIEKVLIEEMNNIKLNENAPEGGGRVVVIQVTSAGFDHGNKAVIKVDKRPVKMNRNDDSNDFRGLNIAIIDPKDGRIRQGRVFDTYKTSEEFEKWISTENIPAGYIVAAACKDECTANLSDTIKNWFIGMGSSSIS